jgi:hypothetical protein
VSPTARLRASLRVGFAGLALVFAFGTIGTAYAAPTAPGVQITNTATASYTDSNNQPYTTQSNTVTTTVQNAPSLTVAPPAAQNVSPGETVVDNYTLTNTGNAPGNFVIPTAPSNQGTLVGYTLSLTNSSGIVQNPCTTAAPCTFAQLQAALATTADTVSNTTNPTATVGIIYTVPQTGITAPQSFVSNLAAEITQPAVATGGGAAASTSALSPTVTVTDTEHPDARIDINKSATTPTTTTAPIVYSFGVNDGGFYGAHDLNSAKLLLGATAPGVIAVLDKLPSFNGFQQSYSSGSDVVPTAIAGGFTTATIYLSTNGTTWVTKANSVAGTNYTYVALYLSGGAGGVELPGNPTGSTGSGTGVTNPQFTFTFGATQPPAGTGSGGANLSNIANSITGGNPGDTGIVPIIAPGVTAGTADGSVTTPGGADTLFGPTETNTTSSPPNAAGGAGGASNTVLVGGAIVNAVLNGPVGLPASVGAYDGTSTASNQLDFTSVAFPCTTNGTTTAPGVTGGTTCVFPTAGVAVPNTLSNTGTASDSFTIAVTPPTGYTVALYVANNCPTTTTTTAVLPIAPYGTAGAECTLGTQLTTTTTGGVVSTSAGQAALTVASGASLNYIAVYTPIAGTTTAPFTPLTADIAAYGSSGTAATPGPDSNDTYNTLYPGGALQLTKSAAIVNNCPTGASATIPATGVCPGGTITYTIAVKNNAPLGQAVAGSGSSSGEPAFAIAGITVKSGAVVTEDGTAAPSTWYAGTYGIDATVAPSFPTNTTPQYTLNGTATTVALHATGSTTKGPSGFTLTFNNAITAGYSGTITFQVTVVNQ